MFNYLSFSKFDLTISDTVANISGQIKAGNIYFYPLNEGKSLYGVMGFAVSTAVVLFIQLPDDAIPEFLVLATLLTIVFEIFSWRGSDNLSIPVGSALFFIVMERHDSALVFFMAVYFLGVMGLPWAVVIIGFFVTSVLFTYIRAKRTP